MRQGDKEDKGTRKTRGQGKNFNHAIPQNKVEALLGLDNWMTRSNPEINDIIQAKERRGKQGFAQFFADLFDNVDLQFGNHEFLYGDSTEAMILFPFNKFKLRATGVDVTGNDVACYGRFVFDEEGKLKA